MDARVAGTIIAAIKDRTRAPTLIARELLRLVKLELELPLRQPVQHKRKSKRQNYEKRNEEANK